MEELTMRAEQMLDIIEQMKALNSRLEALCTGKCERCPLKSECLGDAQFDLGRDYDIEKCADYLDYYDKVKAEELKAQFEAEEEDRLIRAWEDANLWAGVDPAWANIRRK